MADILSLEGDGGLRCVDILPLAGGGYGFKEFRRDPEDGGRWTMVADFTSRSYVSREAARAAAAATIAWLGQESVDGDSTGGS